MTPQQIAQILQDRFSEKILTARPDDKHPRVHVDVAHWREVAESLRHDPAMQFDWLANLSGVDYVADKQFCVVPGGHMGVFAGSSAPHAVWEPAADWLASRSEVVREAASAAGNGAARVRTSSDRARRRPAPRTPKRRRAKSATASERREK